MKSEFERSIAPLYYFFKIFGMSCIEFVNWTQFTIEMTVWSTLHVFYIWKIAEIEVLLILSTNSELFKIDMLIFTFSHQIYMISPLLQSIWLKVQNKKLQKLVYAFGSDREFDVYRKSNILKIPFRRISYLVVFFMVTYLILRLIYVKSYYGMDFPSWDAFHFLLMEFWMISPAIQFCCWLKLFDSMFKMAVQELVDWTALLPAMRDNVAKTCVRGCIKVTISRLKNLLKMKSLIFSIYGICVMVFLGNMASSLMYKIFLLFYKPVLCSNTIFCAMIILNAIFVLFFVVTENSNTSVKKSLNMIHNLVVTQQWSVKDKQLRNFSMSFLHEDLTFRVCDLVDLTYKQLLSITSIAVAFLVIQLQLQM